MFKGISVLENFWKNSEKRFPTCCIVEFIQNNQFRKCRPNWPISTIFAHNRIIYFYNGSLSEMTLLSCSAATSSVGKHQCRAALTCHRYLAVTAKQLRLQNPQPWKKPTFLSFQLAATSNPPNAGVKWSLHVSSGVNRDCTLCKVTALLPKLMECFEQTTKSVYGHHWDELKAQSRPFQNECEGNLEE